jgi:PPOX class probable F420-dependent enzyme
MQTAEMRDRSRVARLTAEARAKLEGRNFGYLAVEDGSPHVSPVWVDTDGEYILVNTARGRVKERAMQKGARVALSIAEHDDPYDHVDIRGRVVRRVEGDEAVEHINALARKYRGPDSTFTLRPGERRVKILIEPTVIA